MDDASTTVEALKTRVRGFVEERDWSQFHTPKNLSMALSAEAAELMEHFLWVDGPGSRELLERADKRAAIRDELADIVIYAFGFANTAGIDLASAIEAKMAANAAKYPVEKARGRSLKYTEL